MRERLGRHKCATDALNARDLFTNHTNHIADTEIAFRVSHFAIEYTKPYYWRAFPSNSAWKRPSTIGFCISPRPFVL